MNAVYICNIHLRTARHFCEDYQQLLSHLFPAQAIKVSAIFGVFRRHDINFLRSFYSVTPKTARIDRFYKGKVKEKPGLQINSLTVCFRFLLAPFGAERIGTVMCRNFVLGYRFFNSSITAL